MVVFASYAPMKKSNPPVRITDAIEPYTIFVDVIKKNGMRGIKEPNTVEESTIAKLRLASPLSTGASFNSKDIINSSIAFGFDVMLLVMLSSASP